MSLKPCKQCGKIPQIKTRNRKGVQTHTIECCDTYFTAKSIRYAEDVIKGLKESWNNKQ